MLNQSIWKKHYPDIILLYLLIHDLTKTSRNNIKYDAKTKVLITIIIALLFPNSRYKKSS